MSIRTISLILASLIIVLTNNAFAQNSADSSTLDDDFIGSADIVNEDWKRFEAFLDGAANGAMNALMAPGLSVVVYTDENGPLIRSYGSADAEGQVKIDPKNDPVPVASISKVFTAVALMKAQEQGLLSLDDPANQYLDFELPTYEDHRAITIRDLTRHEAGFEERWLATGAGYERDERPWGQILAETTPELIAPPGAYSSYSNYGAALLGYIVERVSGRPYYDYLEKEVLIPLEMTKTTIANPLPNEVWLETLHGVRARDGVIRPAGPRTYNVRTYPAGRLVSTLAEMSHFIQMLVNDGVAPSGDRILSSTSMSELLSVSSRSHPKMPGMAVVFAEKDIQGHRFIGHGGDGGTHHTDLLLSPEQGIGFFIAFHSAPGPHARDYVSRSIVPELLGSASFQTLPFPTESEVDDVSQYAGSYRHYRWAFTSIEKSLQLISEFKIADSGRGTLIVQGRLAPGEYVPVPDEEELFQNRLTGEYLHFSESFDGKLNVNVGSFPFVTAFKLKPSETQSRNSNVFWSSVIGMAAVCFLVLVFTGQSIIKKDYTRAAGFGLFALTIGGLAAATMIFFVTAASMSEPALQKAIPPITGWLLSVPFISIILLGSWVVGAVLQTWRPQHWFAWGTIGVGFILVIRFMLFLAQWNALGWNYP
ncbi:MAG: serine hydrolase [Henriciella sp.]